MKQRGKTENIHGLTAWRRNKTSTIMDEHFMDNDPCHRDKEHPEEILDKISHVGVRWHWHCYRPHDCELAWYEYCGIFGEARYNITNIEIIKRKKKCSCKLRLWKLQHELLSVDTISISAGFILSCENHKPKDHIRIIFKMMYEIAVMLDYPGLVTEVIINYENEEDKIPF